MSENSEVENSDAESIEQNLEEIHEMEFSGEKEHLEPEQIESIIESILFISDRPVGLAAIRSAFKGTDVKKDKILSAIERLTTEYAGGRRGICLEQIGGGYQLRNKIDNTKFLRNMGKTKTFKLTGPSLETLSIIAYKQPLTKAEVDHIRGVESGHLVRALMDRGLIAFAGKSEAPGKPMTYGTTKKFLEIFSLRNAKELPSLSEIDELIPQGIDSQEGEKLQINQLAEKLGDSAISNYSVGEEELLEISDELTKITSSTDFFEEEKRRQREKRDRERYEDIKQALAFGEDVSEADVKWLKKYEAAQVEATAAATPALAPNEEPVTESPEVKVEEVVTLESEGTRVENAAEAAAHAAAGLFDAPADEEPKVN
ncbi:MAG: hypothetical protein A4S09_11070 [Proteobacteria bacterium SG_bin7]|nr:MAG: hypothetical protein A4S09_11070 [Proteobacteria bacterium SG_bin7]